MGNEPFIYSGAEALRWKGRNVTSQFGEDGYIAAALERIGAENKWCFEVGAADGLFYSNTKALRDAGWSGVLIESDIRHWENLITCENDRVKCIHRRIVPAGIDSMDCILRDVGNVPKDIDLGVIDIDGQDYWIWDCMTVFRPRLILIEYSPYGTPDDLPRPYQPGQAGINPILALGKRKGYLPLVRTVCNVLFAREDVWPKVM